MGSRWSATIRFLGVRWHTGIWQKSLFLGDLRNHNSGPWRPWSWSGRAVKRQALGRGLDAILGTEGGPGNGAGNAARQSVPPPVPVASGMPAEVPIENVKPGSGQPRRRFDDTALDELAASIKEKGIIQPLVVTETADGYELDRRPQSTTACSRQTSPARERITSPPLGMVTTVCTAPAPSP